jgi:hypothetical protein
MLHKWDNGLCECYISFRSDNVEYFEYGIVVYVNVTLVSEAIKLNIPSMKIVYVNVTSVSEVTSFKIGVG